ncbi:MAG: hydroxyethylthiazole kinase [Alkalibacterium sp.]|nr:hydroxyethylthiazole kinase [Alkalibacterium sp.]
MTTVTGTGCMLSGICGAFLAVGKDTALESTVQACVTYAVAAEMAAENPSVNGPGSFRVSLMDALYKVTDQDVLEKEKIIRYSTEQSEGGSE